MSETVRKSEMEMSSEELIEHFGSSPVPWACHGVGMLRSAYVMWRVSWERFKREYECARGGGRVAPADMTDRCTSLFGYAYKLLAAVAMEDLVKGLLLAKGEVVLKNHALPGWFRTHDIVNLVSQRGEIPLSGRERTALEDCTKAIVWQGRYPMPKDGKGLPRKWPAMEFMYRLNPPVDFRDLAKKILHDYPDEALDGAFVSRSSLIAVLDVECPEPEALNPCCYPQRWKSHHAAASQSSQGKGGLPTGDRFHQRRGRRL